MWNPFVRCTFALNRLGKDLAGAGLLFMTGLVTLDVLLRRVFNAPLIFADEVSGYLLVLVTLMGLGYALREEAHIQVRMGIDHISQRKRVVLHLMISVVAIFYAAILLVYTAELAWESFHLGAFSPTPSQLPLFPFQLIMPLGCLLFLLQLIVGMGQSILWLRSSPPLPSPKKD